MLLSHFGSLTNFILCNEIQLLSVQHVLFFHYQKLKAQASSFYKHGLFFF